MHVTDHGGMKAALIATHGHDFRQGEAEHLNVPRCHEGDPAHSADVRKNTGFTRTLQQTSLFQGPWTG